MAVPTLALVGSVALALASLVLAAAKGSPYLDLSSLNPWVALFAAASIAALFAVPFVIERLLRESHPERAEHWERAMLLWGLVALGALAAGGILLAAGGTPAGSLAGATGLLLVIEAGVVVVALAFLLLSG